MLRKKLHGKNVYLQELQKTFFSDYIAAFSPRVRTLLHVAHVQSELDYVCARLEKLKAGLTFFVCIFDQNTDQLIGALEIRDSTECASQLYSWLHEDYWGTGRYQEALSLATDEYFLQNDKLFFNAHVDVSNKRSYYALKKQGFADIGFFDGPYGKQYKLVMRRR